MSSPTKAKAPATANRKGFQSDFPNRGKIVSNSTSFALAFVPALAFHSVVFDVVDRDGQYWLRSGEIAQALGYAREDKIGQIYSRHADEFTEVMTLTLKLRVKGFGSGCSEKEVRIFSLRGAHLIAMFARTPVAKEFRRWVLDVLDREAGALHPKATKRMVELPPGHIVVDAHKLAAIWNDLGKLRSRIDGLGMLESDLPPSWWVQQAITAA